MPKIQPNQLTIPIQIPAAAAGTYFLDLSQIASLMNRKGLRQGVQWAVQSLETVSNGDVTMGVSTLPSTWIFANAWVKGMNAWNDQQQMVLDDEPSIAGKYRDFKIYYDADHVTAGSANNLLPFGFQTNSFGLDEAYNWDPSDIEIPQDGGALPPVRFKIHGIGPTTATSKSLVQGYALSRARPQQEDPNMPLYGGWLQAIDDIADISAELRQNVQENDSPPYPVAVAEGVNQREEFYPGGANQAVDYQSFAIDILNTRKATALSTDATRPFVAPCGLIRIDVVHGDVAPTLLNVFIHLAAGPHKGFLCMPMQEVN